MPLLIVRPKGATLIFAAFHIPEAASSSGAAWGRGGPAGRWARSGGYRAVPHQAEGVVQIREGQRLSTRHAEPGGIPMPVRAPDTRSRAVFPCPSARPLRNHRTNGAAMKTLMLTIAAVGLCLGACNTMTRGTESEVTITASPRGARIWTPLGHHCPGSPCVVKVERKTDFIAYAEAEGYRQWSIEVKAQL